MIRYEDNLAIIFMGIVLFFLISHLPRILMGIHEVVVHAQTRACEEAGVPAWEPWVHVVTNVSHLLLVVNGSVNSFIYCSLSSRFRAQVVRLAQRAMRRGGGGGGGGLFGGGGGAGRGGCGGAGRGGGRRANNASAAVVVINRDGDDDDNAAAAAACGEDGARADDADGDDGASCLLRRASAASSVRDAGNPSPSGGATPSSAFSVDRAVAVAAMPPHPSIRNGLTQTTQV